MAEPRHGAIVLAAGSSRRLGSPKQLLRLDGETLVHRAARLALATQPDVCIVVVGANAAAVSAAVRDLDVRCVDSPTHANGMRGSLRCGLDALPPDCAGALIVACDQPALSAAHLLRLRDAWRAAPRTAAASAYAATLGVPALLPRAWFDAVVGAAVDRGARDLLQARRGEVVAIEDAALAEDVDDAAAAAGLSR